MRVPAEFLTELTDVINALSKELQPKAKAVVDEIARRHVNLKGCILPEGVAAFRADVVAAMDVLCSGAADIAAVHASEMYDKVREAAGAGSQYRAVAEPFRSPAATEGAVRALVQSVVDTGRVEAFASSCASRLDYEMRRAAAECVVGNARRDPLRPKWARVPSGMETCPFCLMLASFGANYNDKDSISHVHANCDCRMVQMYDGMTVEGYDPDTAYAQTEKCLEAIGGRDGLRRDWEALPEWERDKAARKHGGSSKAFDAYVNKRLAKEMGTRDVEWLKTGKKPKVEFTSMAIRDDKLKNHVDEIWAAIRLRRHGVKAIFVEDEKSYFDEAKGQMQRKGYPDLANGIELKCLDGASSYNTINGHIKNASRKEGARVLVFDNSQNPDMCDADLIVCIKRSQRFQRGRIYIIDHDEGYRFVR